MRLVRFDGHGARILSVGVEIVHEGAAQRLRDACEGMGAALRFRLNG